MMFPFSTSSNIKPSPPPQHEVFINFRGADVRDGFLETLVEVLRKEQVNVYVDKDELRGKDLKLGFKRIEKSKIAITIFSEGYTESKWCLDELVKIKECMDQGNLQVLPIFLNVSTEDVKDLEGNFGRNFRRLVGKSPKANKMTKKANKMTTKWKDAITSVSEKRGLTSQFRYINRFKLLRYFFNDEKDFAKLIAEEIKGMLKTIS